jgi:putative transport protein
MDWLIRLPATSPVAYSLFAISLVSLSGLALGSIRYRGIGLGSAGVLFTGLAAGLLMPHLTLDILGFLKEFGLILFVFTIGIQLGPGFFASWRQQGIQLNLLAILLVVLGTATAGLLGWAIGLDATAIPGLLAGATTNTPSLGAAQQAIAAAAGSTAARSGYTASAYAVAYPMGIIGVIISLLVIKTLFRIDPVEEAERFKTDQQRNVDPLERRSLVVDNPNLDGIAIGDVPGLVETGVIVSRHRRAGEREARTATPATVLEQGDAILVVGTKQMLDRFQLVVGTVCADDLIHVPSQVIHRRVVVTNKRVLGKTIKELGLDHLYGVTVTRITRAGLEMTAVPSLHLQFGDVLQVVGAPESIDGAASVLGNSPKHLNETQFIPMFIGIALGILAGMVPFAVPGMPQPVRLGLAGGPLLVAIIVSHFGRVGPLVWHIPASANLAFRELGLTLFLACVGFEAGDRFFATIVTRAGVIWVLVGMCITVVPVMIVGILGRTVFKLNYVTLSGLLTGSMTDPPALAFAGSVSQSDAPNVAYATVYPLAMFLRILTVQILVLLLL